MVLDGQQRLEALYVAIFGTYDGRRGGSDRGDRMSLELLVAVGSKIP